MRESPPWQMRLKQMSNRRDKQLVTALWMLASVLLLISPGSFGKPWSQEKQPEEQPERAAENCRSPYRCEQDAELSAPLLEEQEQQNASDARTQDSQEQKKHWWNDPTTVTNIVIAFFAGCSAAVGIVQARIYYGQKRIMQHSLRPRIILREAYTFPDFGRPIRITYNFENTGSSDATIANCKFAILFVSIGGTRRQVKFEGQYNWESWHRNIGEVEGEIPIGQKIAAGAFYEAWCQSLSVELRADWRDQVNCDVTGPKTTIRDRDGDWFVHFFGKVAYRDGLGITRNMAFFRRLEFEHFRFVPVGDPQLEYTDERP